ncbi:hypothetical protein AtNW77_Chr4g0302581 [Arabidopsis thaliana]|uniref:Uncharacterized protein n=2 Tax=Arabidopsis TaxID=3701 RepID=A0A178V0M5_ARATH|nr:hypothetical protein ISN45_At04g026580 [Arabidopsis thaliana x Arabidopsis arenosa]OAO99207.1 hypothetical protein AXX17_AT4G29230 [Arabidopsis thaliana]VYS63861.1 unnamed protein product [Arabidopsis thaliana]
MSSENEDSSSVRRRVSCTKCFDALWFCYWMSRWSNITSNGDDTGKDLAPFYQMQQYYRVGKLDDCTKKFSDLFDCLSLKTKRASEAERILEEQEKAVAEKHIWIIRTQDEAVSHWTETFGHLDDPNS